MTIVCICQPKFNSDVLVLPKFKLGCGFASGFSCDVLRMQHICLQMQCRGPRGTTPTGQPKTQRPDDDHSDDDDDDADDDDDDDDDIGLKL